MERLAVALHVALLAMMVVTVWRVWVLGRQVRSAGDAARAARVSGSSDRGVGTALSVYPVQIHARSAASSVTVQKKRPEDPSGPAPVSKAIPILMLNSPSSVKFGDDVAQGYVTHAIAGSVLFETLPGEAWQGVAVGGGQAWARPNNSSDVLVWGRPLSGDAANKFPFPPLRDDQVVQLGEAEAGYSRALVMAF